MKLQIDYIFHCKAIIQPILGNDDADPEVTAKVNELIADQFTHKEKPPFPIPSQHGDENYENMKNKVKDVFTKNRHFKQFEKTSKDRLNSIPKNATIREEFKKCGKETCNLCPHGPYYYGYWKEKTNKESKLKKRYLGANDPRR